MRYWLLKIIELFDTINEGSGQEDAPQNVTTQVDTRSKKNGGTKK